MRPEVIFFRPRPLIWNRGAFSPTLQNIPLSPRVSLGLPFTVNSRLLRYFLVQTLSQKRKMWNQIRRKEEKLQSGNMFSPSLVRGINVCLVQLQDMRNMRENVRQSNLQLVFLQTI